MNSIHHNPMKKLLKTSPLFGRMAALFAVVYVLLFLTMASHANANEYLEQTIDCSWNTIADPEDAQRQIPNPDDELVQLAARLDHDPLKIFTWV